MIVSPLFDTVWERMFLIWRSTLFQLFSSHLPLFCPARRRVGRPDERSRLIPPFDSPRACTWPGERPRLWCARQGARRLCVSVSLSPSRELNCSFRFGPRVSQISNSLVRFYFPGGCVYLFYLSSVRGDVSGHNRLMPPGLLFLRSLGHSRCSAADPFILFFYTSKIAESNVLFLPVLFRVLPLL